MKIHIEQLPENLRRRLLPVYLLSGDEPLQLTEAADAVRAAARAAGYENRELFHAENNFDWSLLGEASNTLPLFGERRILDLRLPAKPDKSAGAALLRYAERPADDAVLLISTAKLAAADQKAKWYQAVDRIGAVIQVWPLEGMDLLRWLERRLALKGLLADQSGIRILAARVEGNLLAASQEIEKLHILYGKARLSDAQIMATVADSARYDVFGLAEELVRGHPVRLQKMLMGLKAEGIAPPVALWALTRELRLLAGLLGAVERGTSLEAAFANFKVWDKRKPALSQALKRLDRETLQQALLLAARADRISKGAESGDAWDALLMVCLSVADAPRNRAVLNPLTSHF